MPRGQGQITLAIEHGTGWAYEAGTSTEDCVGRDSMQPIDKRPERLDQLGITVPELIKGLGLRLEYSENRIRRLASIDVGSQWVVSEILSSAFGILGQGGVEEGFEVGYWGGSN